MCPLTFLDKISLIFYTNLGARKRQKLPRRSTSSVRLIEIRRKSSSLMKFIDILGTRLFWNPSKSETV